MTKSIHYFLALATLCCLQFSMAQSVFSFPIILDDAPPVAGIQATHDTLRWDDFQNYQGDPLYGQIGKAVGQLMVYYRGSQGKEIALPCTATLIADGYLLTNYHCVYPVRKDSNGNEYNIATAKIYMDYNQPNSARDNAPSFAVSTSIVEYNTEPDFAILRTIDRIPFETYGLKNPRFARYQDSNSFFIIHHSAEDLASDHKRLTFRDCVVLNFSNIGATPVGNPDGATTRPAIEGRDVPHFCDTKGGASGSLVFNNRGEIVGLNFAGLRNYSRGKLIPESSRFNLFVNIQAVAEASSKLEEIMFGIDAPNTSNVPNPPTPPAPVVQQGYLSVNSSPSGATVSIDGTVIGTTPLSNRAYNVGNYQLRLSHSGYEMHSESISIRAGQSLQRSISLRAEAPQQGYLSITSSPSGASVAVDGRVIGTTPLSNRAYDVGNYQLSLSYNGYQSYSESISIGARQSLQRSITLRANQPELIRTAEELVRRARQGGTLRLAAGTFRLSSSLELSGDVRLIGQGYEQTRIVSSAGEYVLRYTGGGTFAAQGVGFEYTGNAIADVVRVDNGTLDIDSCQFTGGKFDANNPTQGGNSLEIIGSTRGTVRNSLFNDNGLHGIEVTGNAQPRLEQNRLHDNTWSGVAYFSSAGGSAVGNESYGNGLHGIAVSDNGQPRLEQNRLHDNTEAGLRYGGSAGGSAVGNESYGNGLHGIAVSDNGQPRLEQNRLHGNTYTGIAYFQQASGSARNNQSYDNGQYGIYVASTANPSLSNNTTYGNQAGNVVDER